MDTMTTLNNSYHSQYKQALIDPTQLSEEDLLGLLLKYPYSQPLIFAYERRKKLLNQESTNKELALLYAHSESWLMNYVNKPLHSAVQERPKFNEETPIIAAEKEEVLDLVPEEEVLADEIVDFHIEEDVITLDAVEENEEQVDDAEHESFEPELNEEIAEEENIALVEENVLNSTSEKETKEEDELQIDRLVHEGSVLGDYFAFDSFENKKVDEEISADETPVVASVAEEKEDVSLYNDDLMPYSFRWWLHKTRLEHADTYQPYAISNVALTTTKPQIDVSKIEDSILDQQIKENIIHFQDPEEKLSEEVKRKPVVPLPPKKGSDIIEKFIQKDPIIHPPSPENINNENMARQSAEDNYLLVTETLANIYIDQALYLKAIEVLKKLILKYPEKKSYFATRIEELEKNL